jgi:hypothetical protein
MAQRSKRQRIAETPGHDVVHPWRWQLGRTVHALGHAEPLKVVGGELWLGCPHLHLIDGDGVVWRVPQLHTSSKVFSRAE